MINAHHPKEGKGGLTPTQARQMFNDSQSWEGEKEKLMAKKWEEKLAKTRDVVTRGKIRPGLKDWATVERRKQSCMRSFCWGREERGGKNPGCRGGKRNKTALASE